MTMREVMGIIGTRLGKEVKVERLEFKDAVNGLLVRLFGTEEVEQSERDTAQRMLLFYKGRGLKGNSNVLKWVLGREETRFGEWVEEQLGNKDA